MNYSIVSQTVVSAVHLHGENERPKYNPSALDYAPKALSASAAATKSDNSQGEIYLLTTPSNA
ncbi:hypothetical protein [Noviherbaspirillum sp. ST9]|uniref:hypothetical protein n=1 Tax=Noviherbaspirillum sp. ST9 TaxID=3401606 RepID=UPI003B589D4C